MAVDFISYGYDTVPGEGLSETIWQDMFPAIGLASYAVRSPLDWKVTAVAGADRTVSIAAGRGFGLGVIDKTVDNDTIQLAAITSGSRWDLVAVRRDPTPTAGVSEFIAISGGATPVIPGGRLAGPGIHDQPLALVQVTAGQTQPTGFIDLRTWAGDGGGLVANHDLVRSYLNKTGTRIMINGIDWVRRVGANDTPEWIRQISPVVQANTQTVGSGMATNAFTTGTLQPIIQAGTFVGTTTASGDLTITYPTVFPGGVIGGIGFSGDGVYIVSATPSTVASPTTSSLFLRFALPGGGAVVSTTVRGTWIAVGW